MAEEEQNQNVPAAPPTEGATPQEPPKQNKLLVYILIVLVVIVIGFIGFQFKVKGDGSLAGSKYVVLFDNLDLTEAGEVVEGLKQAGYKDYLIEDDGRRILVPRKKKSNIGISLAQAGLLPSGGVMGYEIFDKGGALGATDFDKRIKFTRALNGELSRNISRIYGIEEARVLIVLPEKQLFSTEKNPVTAAIFVKIVEGQLLTPEQVQGIISLSSSSVEDLQKEHITVVDYHGRVLSSDEYVRNYDKLFALLQAQRAEVARSKTSIFKSLVSFEAGSKESKVAQAYKALEKSKQEKKEREMKSLFGLGRGKELSAKDLMELKLKFKEKYEAMMEGNIEKIISQFLPAGSSSVKVNVELNNLQEGPVQDADSMLSKVSTIILLDEKNKEIKLTPEIKEALFKAIAAVTGYVRGRDTIDLRWAPMLNIYEKPGLSGSKFSAISMPKINMKYLFYFIGIIFLFFIISSIKKRRVVIPESGEGDASIFDRGEPRKGLDDLAAPSVDQVKNAIKKAPEKVANVLERWFAEDEE